MTNTDKEQEIDTSLTGKSTVYKSERSEYWIGGDHFHIWNHAFEGSVYCEDDEELAKHRADLIAAAIDQIIAETTL